VNAALALYAALATAWAIAATLSRYRWRRSYRASLAKFGELFRPHTPTPHEKAAATRQAKRLAEMQRHRLALEASMRGERAQ
jgi:transposase-like protein